MSPTENGRNMRCRGDWLFPISIHEHIAPSTSVQNLHRTANSAGHSILASQWLADYTPRLLSNRYPPRLNSPTRCSIGILSSLAATLGSIRPACNSLAMVVYCRNGCSIGYCS